MLGLVVAMIIPDFFLFILAGLFIFSLLVAVLYHEENKLSVLVGLFCIGVGILTYTTVFRSRTETVQPLYNQKATVTAKVTQRYLNAKGKFVYTFVTQKIIPTDTVISECPQQLKIEMTTKTDFYAEQDEIIRFDVQFSESNPRAYNTFHHYSEGVYLYASAVSQMPEILGNVNNDNFFRCLRSKIRLRLERVFNRRHSALLYAFLIGDKSELDESIKENFRTAGLSHIIAVSGLHLSIIAGFLFMVLSKITRTRKVSAVCTIAFIVFYVFLTDCPYSVIRSAIMNIFALTTYLNYRKTQSVNSLGIAGMGITVFNPLAVGNLGFLMSFSATLGIILLERTVSYFVRKIFFRLFPIRLVHNERFQRIVRKTMRYISECIGVSVSAVIGTLPVFIFILKKFSVYFLLANLIVTTIAPIVIILGFAFLILSCIVQAHLLRTMIILAEQMLCKFILNTAETISTLPYSVISLDSEYIDKAFCVVWIVIVVLFIKENFRIRQKGKCTALCTGICLIICSFGYFIEKQTLHFYLTGNDKGIILVEKTFDTANILFCGGDNYHYQWLDHMIFDKDIQSLCLFGDNAYYSKYARQLTEKYTVQNIFTYAEESYGYISQEKINIPQNGAVRYPEYTVYSFTIHKKNWCYVDTGNGQNILIAPNKADGNDIPEEYQNIYIAILPQNCTHTENITAENILVCKSGETFIIKKSFDGEMTVWQN